MSLYYLSGVEQANNNGGSVLRASTSGTILSNVAIPLNPDELPFASTVVLNVNTKKALPLGTFAYNNQDPIIKGSTTKLNGSDFSPSATDISSTGNAAPELTSSIHPIQEIRTRLTSRAMRDGKFNYFSGKFDVGYPDVQLDNLNTDLAANPSRKTPGRLNFAFGKKLISYTYHSKNG